MPVDLRYPDPNQGSCITTYLGCHLPVYRYCTSETPSEPKEVQQGTGISSIDHMPLPVLRGTGHAQKAHPTPN